MTVEMRTIREQSLRVGRDDGACAHRDNDNDNDTLREVPHPSNEGLALQARVYGVMTPRKNLLC